MGDPAALDGMARRLLRRGVTSFLPTAVTAPLGELVAFAERVRSWLPNAPADGAEPLGFNLEGPFLAEARRGAHDPATSVSRPTSPPDAGAAHRRPPADDGRARAAGCDRPDRLVPPWRRDVDRPLRSGRSTKPGGFRAGGTSTTHLFNAMSGVDHHAPGLAVEALVDDSVYVELIADGEHVHPVALADHHPDETVGQADARE